MLFYYSVMKANVKKEEARCAQMTIFYDGKVIVFDDVPADKAKDIMDFSTKGITSTSQSQNHNNNYACSSFLARNSPNNSLQDYYQVPSIPVIYGKFFGYIMFERVFDLCHGFVFCVFLTHEILFMYSDLPMTRKASLHRFLEKRKDR
jgi:jasmonate ZIM domain-containing protein